MIVDMVNLCHENGVNEVYISGLTHKGFRDQIYNINELLKANANLAIQILHANIIGRITCT